MPLTATALVTGGIGIYKAIKGASDTADAKTRAKYNIRPTYDIQPEYFQNQQMAQSLAQGGLTDAAKNYYQTNADRGLGASLGASLTTGGGVNTIQDLYDKYDQGNRAIAAADSEQKIKNIQNLMTTNNQLADQKTQKWVLDKYQPYLDTAKSIAGEKAQGAGELNSGLNTIAGAVSSYADGKIKQEDTISKTRTATPENIIPNTASGTGVPANDTSIIGKINPNYQIPGTYTPASQATIEPPDTTGDLEGFVGNSRQIGIDGIMSKYKNSPYAPGLYDYLKQTA